ncbi:hypothetical protein GCM10023340_28530 [Nocardioides marinquilinus]|uniref:Uncharacterized protein n=1 Tax=Nocardioides marinquilinus TaxID=1210400 RepID=A0ABP9PR79_9ACTN
MRRPTRRPPRPDLPVGSGERLLAWAHTTDGGAVGGTRDAFYLPERLPWEQVEAADWDVDTTTLTVTEVGRWGEVRPRHRLELDDPDRLLQLVRERVTASVVLVRHVPVDGRRGLRVVARRAPGRLDGPDDLAWVYEFDAGVDPDDPAVRLAAAEALAAARAEVGLG